MAVQIPSWLPFALGAAAMIAGAVLIADVRSTPNSGQLIVPETAYIAVTIG